MPPGRQFYDDFLNLGHRKQKHVYATCTCYLALALSREVKKDCVLSSYNATDIDGITSGEFILDGKDSKG